jgi:hypothetical protein
MSNAVATTPRTTPVQAFAGTRIHLARAEARLARIRRSDASLAARVDAFSREVASLMGGAR